jgi:streptogramin lyase
MLKLRLLILVCLFTFLAVPSFGQNIITVAGGGPNNMPALSANVPASAVALDSSGNLYVASSSRVFRVDASGQLTVYAGNGRSGWSGDSGPATSAALSSPAGVAVDGAGNLFIADYGNQRIRRVDAVTGVISTVAGNGTNGFSGDSGPATSAALSSPAGVAVDGAGNLFIADQGNYRVRRVDAATQVITTVAGGASCGENCYVSGEGGPATAAQLVSPTAVALDSMGNLFIADDPNALEKSDNRVRRVDAVTQVITTVAGNGAGGYNGDGVPATEAALNDAIDIAVDSGGNLFIADRDNERVRRVDAATGVITTVAGNGMYGYSGEGGPATSAGLGGPSGVAVDSAGNLFIADQGNQRIRRVDGVTQVITTVVGNGTSCFSGDGRPATDAALCEPWGVTLDSAGNLFIADQVNQRIRRVDAVTGVITTVAGNGTVGYAGDGGPATSAGLAGPSGVTLDSAGNLFIADYGSQRIRRVDAVTGVITTVAGNGYLNPYSCGGYSGDGVPATSTALNCPRGVAVDSAGNLFIADYGNQRIRRVDAVTGVITTVAGNGIPGEAGDGGPATSAELYGPSGVAVDSAGNLFIVDYDGWVRRVDAATQVITTVAGGGAGGDGGPANSAQLKYPLGVAVDGTGNVFIAEWFGFRVRRVDAATGVISTVAGDGTEGFSGDGGPSTSAQLAGATGVVVDSTGNLFIVDAFNSRIREVIVSR